MIHRLREIITSVGATQEAFAHNSNIVPSVISEICNGKKNLGEEHIVAICNAYPQIEPYMFFIDLDKGDSLEVAQRYDKASEREKITIQTILGMDGT